jgi:hypothetical protein
VKAAELIKIEPFAEILTTTVSRFLKLRFGGDWQVLWARNSRRAAGQLWIVNLNVNSVFRPGVNPRALEIIKREFATSVIPWKRPFQRFYFWLATNETARAAAHAFVRIDPSIPDSTQWLMIPGTHKIRFVNAAEGVVYCHLKTGSSLDHFQAENDAREFAADKGLPVPRILEWLSDDCVAEEMIVGTPLNRLTSSKDSDAGLKCAMEAMELLYRSTAKQVDVEEYLADLVSRISVSAQTRREAALTGAETLGWRICESAGLAGFMVDIVRSHGDFQPGNILFDHGAIWLIDWEYSKDRQRQYDRLTYYLKARFAPGLGKRIVAYANSLSELTRMRELRLFLVESIVFELEAASAAPSRCFSRSLSAILAEIEVAFNAVMRSCKA